MESHSGKATLFHYEQDILDFQSLNPCDIKRLAIYDFDSTLFNSPLPNNRLWTKSFIGTIISDCQWFLDSRTLIPPYVPETPGSEWWNLEILNSAHTNLARTDTLTILLTGRQRLLFESRIKSLCQQQQLNFDFFFLKENSNSNETRIHNSTIDFKIDVINCLLQKFQCVKELELFDDRASHVNIFEENFKTRSTIGQITSYKASLVSTNQFMPVPTMDKKLEYELVLDLIDLCNKKVEECKSSIPPPLLGRQESHSSISSSHKKQRSSIYQFRSKINLTEFIEFTGIMLDLESRQRLELEFPCPPGFQKKIHHVTVSLGAINTELHQKLGGFGTEHHFIATHYGSIEDIVSAVKVDGPTLVAENETMHVTLYVSEKGTSAQSNSITNWQVLPTNISLKGTYEKQSVFGIKKEPKEQEMKKEVSIGNLVLKHHPNLVGSKIGIVVKSIHDWMARTCIENSDSNKASLEFYIQNICIEDIVNNT